MPALPELSPILRKWTHFTLVKPHRDFALPSPAPAYIKIGARKYGIQLVLVLHQALVTGFRVAELAFDDAKNMLHFAPH
jgi:hypothetical protein